MDSNSDPWETWTISYGERCIENEHSLQDALLQSEKKESISWKKYITIGICVIVIIVGTCGLVFFLI